jgi:hypothetical protein
MRQTPRVRPATKAPLPLQLAQVLTATALVAGGPIAVVWWLRASGTVSSALLCLPLGMVLSLGASQVGCVLWEKRPGSEDLLFSELMIWGYVHRLRTQRRLACALDMLGASEQAQPRDVDGLGAKQRAKLLERLVAGIETRDSYLHGHSRRVARHAWMIARRMNLPSAEVARVRTAAAIHDVGKIHTPTAILHKAGPLDDDEYEVIKRHPGEGAQMADVLDDAQLTSMVRHHHERLDGTGYPDALSGGEIPLGARIIAVADTFDAITSGRPYRRASPHKKAIDILKEEAGTRLDPAVVRAFCGHYAGRRPLAASSFLAALPERLLSWLGGSASSIATSAKVIAVAALVGGAAVTSSSFALPASSGHPGKRSSGSTIVAHAKVADSSSTRATPGGASHVTGAAHSRRPSRDARTTALEHAASTGPVESSRPAGESGAGVPSGSQAATTAAGESPAGKTEEASSAGSGESPRDKGEEGAGKAKGEETASKGKSEETSSKGKSEETSSKGKSEEHSSKGKSEESSSKGEEKAGKAKTEETASKGKTEEAGGKEVVKEVKEVTKGVVKEVVKEVPAKTEEVVGTTKEVVGTTKEVVGGTTKEVVGKTKEVLGKL